jgi:hypothetical protein
VTNISANSNPKSKSLQQLYKRPVPKRFLYKKNRESSFNYRNGCYLTRRNKQYEGTLMNKSSLYLPDLRV